MKNKTVNFKSEQSETLELKHIAYYLPYNVEVKQLNAEKRDTFTLDVEGLRIMEVYGYEHFSLVLRPLSDIQKYFEPLFTTDENISKLLSEEYICPFSINDIGDCLAEYLPFNTFQLLIEHHFDVYELIDKGFAIDMNTLDN